MNIARSFLLIMSGVIAGVGFVLSCGDNLTAKATADAAVDAPKAPVCDCPTAEPPLAGRLMVFSQTATIPPNDTGAQGLSCPAGTLLITGSCRTDDPTTLHNVTLRESGFSDSPPSAWLCSFRNNESMPVTIRASVVCLKPAP